MLKKLCLLALCSPAHACGWWEKCADNTDVRYNPSVSNDLTSQVCSAPHAAAFVSCAKALRRPPLQHEIWAKLAGLWIGELSFYDGEGEVMNSSHYHTQFGFGWPYQARSANNPGSLQPPTLSPLPHTTRSQYGQYKGYINITVEGTRFYQHNVFVYPPATAEFCALPVPAGRYA